MGLTKYQRKRVKENLAYWYEQVSDKEMRTSRMWYPNANQWVRDMAEDFGLSPHLVAGVVSALSPRNKWERNLADAREVIACATAGGRPDDVTVCTFNSNKDKAFEILRTGEVGIDPYSAPKTHAFVQNIAELDPDRVTIDVWHQRAAFTGMTQKAIPKSLTTARYREIEAITIEMAHGYSLEGYELQSIIWDKVRNS